MNAPNSPIGNKRSMVIIATRNATSATDTVHKFRLAVSKTSNPAGAFFWTGVSFAGIAYSKAKVKPEEAPKTWKDMLDPRWRNAMSCKISSSGMQFVQWYMFRKLYGPDYWKEFSKQRPRAFDSRVQLFDRLATLVAVDGARMRNRRRLSHVRQSQGVLRRRPRWSSPRVQPLRRPR